MPVPDNQKELTELFKALGAEDPESWADSQTTEGINQLHRFLFLRQAWQRVVSENDDAWIDEEIAYYKRFPVQPFAGIGKALKRMEAKGVEREDIVDLVRGMQVRLLADFCYLLDDPSLDEAGVEDLGWALVEANDDCELAGTVIGGLHESVLSTDPTGREMRPRNKA
ncbi:hypothetical protein [Undibacterium squillarum]|uniref:Uncharacterized protein n=1 Tax=Undibacterium squillarum TaxID=1131567 RepID=A0ABQ2XYI3_9BURK|nr:hypothetical protein [Undibacterium squillarum]GGX41506.1 hypothetical protein GCM10010946_20030 [Undibacterium squillarum]